MEQRRKAASRLDSAWLRLRQVRAAYDGSDRMRVAYRAAKADLELAETEAELVLRGDVAMTHSTMETVGVPPTFLIE